MKIIRIIRGVQKWEHTHTDIPTNHIILFLLIASGGKLYTIVLNFTSFIPV